MSETPNAALPAQPQSPQPQAAPATFPRHDPAGEPSVTAPKPVMHHLLSLHERPNIWQWKAKDKSGQPVQFAPGKFTHVFRGPTNPRDAKALAEIYLSNARNEAMRAGYEDPGYALDESSLQAVGSTAPVTPETIGSWRPDGAVPLTLGVGLMEPKDGGQGPA